MKVAIVNGSHEADYIIGMYNNKKNKLIVINQNSETCKYLSSKNKIDVMCGKPTKEYDLRCAQIDDADLFIALGTNDVDNYISCKMAKKIFNVSKCIATVVNPKNVDIFKKLGIDVVISSTYLLGQSIKVQASLEKLINTLSIENARIIISEIEIKKEYGVCDKTLKSINFPSIASVSCIYRYPHVIIPNGTTIIKENDKLVLVTTPNHQKEILNFIQRQ